MEPWVVEVNLAVAQKGNTWDLNGKNIGYFGVEHLAEAWLKGNTSVQRLKLGGNQIGDDGVERLSEVLKGNTSVQKLHLWSNQIGDDGVKCLALALKGHTSVQQLDLSDNKIGEVGAKHLAEALKGKTTVQALSLGVNQIGGNGVKHLAEALKTNTSVQALDLENNQIGEDGVKHLAEALKDNTSVQTLVLSGNQIGGDGVKHLAEALKGNTSLHTLSLMSNQIGGDGVKHLAEALKGNTSVQTVGLSYNQIGDDGVKHLAEVLKGNTSVQTLYLGGNKIGGDGVKHLAEALKGNTSVQELYLDSNGIGDDGVKHLADALKGNTTLQKLYLAHSQIGGDGVKHLAEGLKGNTSVQALYLAHNQIGEDGVKHLAEALKGNTTLQNLYLAHNQIGDDGVKHLAEALKANMSLQTLGLEDNDIGDDGVKHLAEALAFNWTLQQVYGIPERELAAQLIRNRNASEDLRALFQENSYAQPLSARLFFCGDGEAGKTTMCRSLLIGGSHYARLLIPSCLRLPSPKRTLGIEMGSMALGEQRQLILWDLAGQQEYHVLHDLLLPERTIYAGKVSFFLVVIDNSEEFRRKQERLKYWLSFITSSLQPRIIDGERSTQQVLVVLTKEDKRKDGQTPSGWVEEVAEKFCSLIYIEKKVFVTDNKLQNSALNQLRKHLKCRAAAVLKSQPKAVPLVCEQIRSSLPHWQQSRLFRPTIVKEPVQSTEKFIATWQAKYGLFGARRILAAAEYLHDTGDLIFVTVQAKDQGDAKEEIAPDTSASMKQPRALPLPPRLRRSQPQPRSKHGGFIAISPQWFCKKVVGEILLPHRFVIGGEPCDGRFDRKKLLDEFEQLPGSVDGKKEAVLQMLVALGLCYEVGGQVLVPALLKKEAAFCFDTSLEGQTLVGRRFNCRDAERAIFTPSFFPRLQAKLYETFGSRDMFHVHKGQVKFHYEDRKVIIQMGDKDEFVDVLAVRSCQTDLAARKKLLDWMKDPDKNGPISLIRNLCYGKLDELAVFPSSFSQQPESRKVMAVEEIINRILEKVETPDIDDDVEPQVHDDFDGKQLLLKDLLSLTEWDSVGRLAMQDLELVKEVAEKLGIVDSFKEQAARWDKLSADDAFTILAEMVRKDADEISDPDRRRVTQAALKSDVLDSNKGRLFLINRALDVDNHEKLNELVVKEFRTLRQSSEYQSKMLLEEISKQIVGVSRLVGNLNVKKVPRLAYLEKPDGTLAIVKRSLLYPVIKTWRLKCLCEGVPMRGVNVHQVGCCGASTSSKTQEGSQPPEGLEVAIQHKWVAKVVKYLIPIMQVLVPIATLSAVAAAVHDPTMTAGLKAANAAETAQDELSKAQNTNCYASDLGGRDEAMVKARAGKLLNDSVASDYDLALESLLMNDGKEGALDAKIKRYFGLKKVFLKGGGGEQKLWWLCSNCRTRYTDCFD